MERKILKYKDFNTKKRMDAIKNDKFSVSPNNKQKKRISNPSKKILKWDNETVSVKPEHLDPEERANELLKVKGFIQTMGRKQAKEDAEKYDSGITKKFNKLCKRLDLDFDKDYFKKLKDETKDFIATEKYRWNLPRPEQTAKLLGINFDECYETETSKSPSYPSGHAIQSNIFAEVLSKLYPEHRSEFFQLANLISLSRMAAGVHYMADIKEGKRLANVLMETGKVELPKS